MLGFSAAFSVLEVGENKSQVPSGPNYMLEQCVILIMLQLWNISLIQNNKTLQT